MVTGKVTAEGKIVFCSDVIPFTGEINGSVIYFKHNETRCIKQMGVTPSAEQLNRENNSGNSSSKGCDCANKARHSLLSLHFVVLH